METLIISTLLLFAAYSFASSGSLLSEKSGVANISIEGNMIMGSILYCVFSDLLIGPLEDTSGEYVIPIISVIIAGILTMIFSSLFSIIVLRFKSDQIIVGTGINLLSPALATFIGFLYFGTSSSASLPYIPVLTQGNNIYIYPIIFLILAIILLLFLGFYINKTRSGLRIKAAGENPYALETSGISVDKTRRKMLLFAGLLSGMAGAIWVQTIVGGFHWTVFGAGFMAVGIVIFSQWRVGGLFFGSLIIGFLTALTQHYLEIEAIKDVEGGLLLLLQISPYLIPLIVLIFSKASSMPKKLGEPFKKDER
ncbi:MAG: ABC transporter permease [Candidatus Tyloplasma litorale]|nr:MAG: ABC transporter permease [Mycoplasmatales bacterium]